MPISWHRDMTLYYHKVCYLTRLQNGCIIIIALITRSTKRKELIMPEEVLRKFGVATVHAPDRLIANEGIVEITNSWRTVWKFRARKNAGKSTLVINRMCRPATENEIRETLASTAEIDCAHLLGFMESKMAKMFNRGYGFIAFLRNIDPYHGMLHKVLCTWWDDTGKVSLHTDYSGDQWDMPCDWMVLSRDLLDVIPV